MIKLKKIAAVVVTYNRIELLKKCIAALKNQTAECDVLIIDNASTDDTAQYVQRLEKQDSKLHYHNTGSNIGGAGGFNCGMRKAVESGYDYIWIMDDDCIPNPDSLEKLLAADEKLGRGNYGYLSSRVLWTDGSECKMNRQKYGRQIVQLSDCDANGFAPVHQSTFVSILFPAATIRKVGLPVKEFFIWGDDIEYTRRISVRNNMPSFMVADSTVVHEMKENTGSSIATDIPQRINRYQYAFRNENYLYRKEGIKGVVYYILKCGLNFTRIIFKAKDHRLKRCWVLVSSMVKGFLFNPKTEEI